MSKTFDRQVVVYQAKNGAIELRDDTRAETVWATQAQIAEAFGVDVRTVSEHMGNIYTTKELNKPATIRNFRIVRVEGKRTVTRNVQHFNLDVILSVELRTRASCVITWTPSSRASS